MNEGVGRKNIVHSWKAMLLIQNHEKNVFFKQKSQKAEGFFLDHTIFQFTKIVQA